MKKFGFTLAEVLVALGIIGVISALAMPTFITSTQNQTNSSKLSTEVSNLENAFAAMMLQEDVESLEETAFFSGTLKEEDFVKYFKMMRSSDKFSDMGYPTGTSLDSPAMSSTEITMNTTKDPSINLISKSGAVIIIQKNINDESSEQRLSNGANCGTRVGTVVIDVNGASSPNKAGRDYFGFALGGDGQLYPVGSKTASLLLDNSGEDTNTYKDGSEKKSPCTGLSCTARLIENGYKMDY